MRKGFTLLEMMIVVLIIGILSAIAIPLYMKVVERSRTTEALTIIRTLAESVQRAAKLRGNVTWDNIDINIEGTLENGSMKTKFFKYSIINEGGNQYYILAESAGPKKYAFEKHIHSGDIFPAVCVYNDPDGQEVCDSMKFKTALPANMHIVSPGTGLVQ